MKLKRLAVAGCILIVAALAALAIAFHYYFDPRLLATSLAASVKADTGRELSFDEVGIRLLPRPALVLSEVRFGNAAWGSQPWLAQTREMNIDFDVMELVAGRLRIKRIEVTGASVLLETDRDGNGNWVTGRADASSPAWFKAIEIDEISLEEVAFTYRDGATGKTRSVQIDSARVAAGSASAPIHLEARATFDSTKVEATGTIGALAALIANAPSYPVDLDVKFGAGSVSVRGTIDQPRDFGRFNLALRVEFPEPADYVALSGAALPPLGPIRGAAQLTGTPAAPGLSAIDATFGGGSMPEIKLRGVVADLRAASGLDWQLTVSASEWWRPGTVVEGQRLPPFRASARVRDARQGYLVDNLELKIADSTVSASLQVARAGQRLRITGKAASPLIDLSHMAPAKSGTNASSTSGSPRATDHWKLADVDLDLKIGRLVFPDGRQLQASGRLALDNGRLKANALQATLGGANVKLNGTIAEPQKLTGLDLGIALQGSELAELFRFFGKNVPAVGPFQGHARLRGSLDALGVTAIDAAAGRPGQNLRVGGEIDDALHWRGVQLAIAANVSDSVAAGRLFNAELPRLPALRATARVTGPQGGYAFDDLRLTLGRTSVQGRVAFAPGEPRPRVTASLSGPLVDLSELPSVQAKAGEKSVLLAADVEADIRFNRVVLPDRRALGPVSGTARLTAGAVELKQFSVAVDGASATLDGRINDPLTPAALDFMVNAKVTKGAGLAAFTGLNLQDLPDFTASGRLTDVSNGYVLAGLKLASAATTIAGDVAVTRGAKRLKVSAKVTSPLLDVSAFMQPAAAASGAKPASPRARAIPDVPLPLDVVRVIDADFDLRVDTVKFGDAPPLGPLVVRATIADGLLRAEPVELTAQPGQTLSVSGTVDATQSAWALRIDGAGIDFGEMLTRFGRPKMVTGGVTDFALQLEARGKTLPEVLGSLNGNARIKVGPYRIHNFAVPLEGGIVIHMFGLANPFLKTDPDTDVKCLTARVPMKNGVITSDRRVATETAKYNAVMSGTVNLRTEELDLAVTPVVRGEVKTVVRLRGTLAAPVVDVNAVGAVTKSAASLGAAVVTFGGSLVADTLIRKVASDPSPCATALAQ